MLSIDTRQHELLVRSFLRHLRAEGRAKTTIQRYELSLWQFYDFARRMGFPPVLTREHLAHYLETRMGERAANTVRNDHAALSRYFAWLLEEGEISSNPMERIKPPRVQEHIPDPYSDDEVRAMLRVCKGRTPDALRNAAIIWVLFDTGLRASEFCSLTLDDADLDAERILVRGKGGKQRVVRLGYRAQQAVDRYLRVRRSARPELWLNRVGRPLTPEGLYQAIERVCRQAGVGNPGVHRFRHTSATKLRDLGADERELMTLMGWSTYSMAARYTRATARERALRAHSKFSPGDNLDLKGK